MRIMATTSVAIATHGAGERGELQPLGMHQRRKPMAPIMVSTQYFVISASAPTSQSQMPERHVRSQGIG
jgi:hypothetical protein